MEWVGLDIGGANIKMAPGQGQGVCRPFALWENPAGLEAELTDLFREVDSDSPLAITMTGELADCFADKNEGVCHIVESAVRAAADRQLRVYSTTGRWLSAAELATDPQLTASVAAANWHALARFGVRFGSGSFQVLLDIGSTTSDITPIQDGLVPPTETNDTERLARGELVYAGVRRTPVSSLVCELPFGGQQVPIARELFATTLDVYLLLEELVQNPSDHATADGRPATRKHAAARMARMVCACPSDVGQEDAVQMAREVSKHQQRLIQNALERVFESAGQESGTLVLCGEGSFLGRQVAQHCRLAKEVVSLEDELGAGLAAVAPALAVAVLASEEVSL
jgi:probable H4MPT-linked C1 transfer pathway protein